MPQPPSEFYLAIQRAFTFLDEWLFYGLLLYLYTHDHLLLMVPVTILGASFVLMSYRRQWAMERLTFGRLFDD